jgi:transposase-like protein
MASISAPHFKNEDEARKHLEALRWPEGPVCPHCGTVGNAYATKRAGTYRCASKGCRKDFSVTVGTVYERSHIPLHKWLLASYLLCSSTKRISSHQLHRMLGVTYKSAWFMTHRIREAMQPGKGEPSLGGKDKTVEADETVAELKASYAQHVVRQRFHAEEAKKMADLLIKLGIHVRKDEILHPG